MTAMDERACALAGLAQALGQVRRIAESGQAEQAIATTALDSVFRIDATSVPAVYGGSGALRPGLEVLQAYFDNRSGDGLLPRLALAVIQVERRFVADHDMVTRVRDGILALEPLAQARGSAHPDVVAALGRLYSDTISGLQPRIMVQGNPHYLGQADVVSEIRAMLLAALRSAVLWRQMDGSLWDFVLRRRSLTAAVADGLDGAS